MCVCVDSVADVGGRDEVVTFHPCNNVNKSDFINHSQSYSYQHTTCGVGGSSYASTLSW